MNYSMLRRITISLFSVFSVMYFSGVNWEIDSPIGGQEILRSQNVDGLGRGPKDTNYLFKFVKMSNSIQEVAGTSTSAAPPPADPETGNWSNTLVPPTAAPFSGNWPLGAATVAIYEGATFKESQVVVIVNP